jgi:hypothetical protein
LLIIFPAIQDAFFVRLRRVNESGITINAMERGWGISCLMALEMMIPIDEALMAVILSARCLG